MDPDRNTTLAGVTRDRMTDHTVTDGTRPSRLRRLMQGTLAALGLALPFLADAGCKVEIVEMPVKMVGSRAVATVGLNGTPVPLTVDSGAYFSLLTDAAAAQLGLTTRRAAPSRIQGISGDHGDAFRFRGLTGSIDARLTTVDKVTMLKGEFGKVEFLVGGNEPGAGTMGLMGRNMLTFTDTEYDLAHGMVRFLFPSDDCAEANMAYWAGSTPVTEVDLIRDYGSRLPEVRALVKLNGKDVKAVFDTGATTIVSTSTARRVGVAAADMKPAGTVFGAGHGRADAFLAPFDRFEIGGERILHNTLPVADFDLEDADMLLGIDFFLSHRIYVSKAQSRMFITYNGGPVFALDRSVGEGKGEKDGSDVASAAPAAASRAAAGMTGDQLARRGAASASRRDYKSALADLDRACELEPTVAAWFTQRGILQQDMRRSARALEDFDRALALDPAQEDARIHRAEVRGSGRDRDGAKADLVALDQALPPQADRRLAMAHVYLAIDRPTEAIAQLDQWLAAHPNDAGRFGALNSRCWARARLGTELDRALADCDDAIDGDGKNWAYLDSRGWVYLRMGNLRKALADFDRSVENRPENAWSLYGRGLARSRMGDAARATSDFEAARQARPDIEAEVQAAGLPTAAAAAKT